MILPPQLQPYRLLAEAVLVLAVIGVGTGWWIEHNHKEQQIGANKVITQDTAAVAKRTDVEAKADHDAIDQLNRDNDTLRTMLAKRPIGPVSVYRAAHCPTGPSTASGTVNPAPGSGDGNGVRTSDSEPAPYRLDPGLQLMGAISETLRNQLAACRLRAAELAR